MAGTIDNYVEQRNQINTSGSLLPSKTSGRSTSGTSMGVSAHLPPCRSSWQGLVWVTPPPASSNKGEREQDNQHAHTMNGYAKYTHTHTLKQTCTMAGVNRMLLQHCYVSTHCTPVQTTISLPNSCVFSEWEMPCTQQTQHAHTPKVQSKVVKLDSFHSWPS